MNCYVDCKCCDGSGVKIVSRYGRYGYEEKKSYPCKACNGSGISNSLYKTECNNCHTYIIYPRDKNAPKYCKTCKERMRAEYEAKWKTIPCKKCHTAIKYNVDWSKIPELCKDCIEKEKAKWKLNHCKNCGISIRYNTDWGKAPTLCKACKEKEQAKWQNVSCTKCGVAIKYSTDWDKIPKLCKRCAELEKSKWHTKDCEACGRDIRYSTDWPNPPKFCRDCTSILKALKDRENINKSKALERFHTQPRVLQSGIKKTGTYVTVKSGYNRNYNRICSDIIVRDKNLKGQHYHFVVDIDGNILQDGLRDDH